jgi:predicted nucleic acid-binding Zn ribbon protein
MSDEIRQLHEEVARRQYRQKQPQPIAETLSKLMARRGYAYLQTSSEREEAWRGVVGERMAAYSRLGNVRRGVLEVTVRNSAVLQELTFQKKQLLQRITAALPEQQIRDLRFRVGAVD